MKRNVADTEQTSTTPLTTTMVHGQLVYFDRDPSLWLAHTIPRASYHLTEPTLLAASMPLVMFGLATMGFFTAN